MSINRLRWGRSTLADPDYVTGVTLRFAFPDDEAAVERLAALDGRPVPPGPLMLAEVGGELWAAVSLERREAIADPFRPTAELVLTLHERSRRLRAADTARHRAAERRLRTA